MEVEIRITKTEIRNWIGEIDNEDEWCREDSLIKQGKLTILNELLNK